MDKNKIYKFFELKEQLEKTIQEKLGSKELRNFKYEDGGIVRAFYYDATNDSMMSIKHIDLVIGKDI